MNVGVSRRPLLSRNGPCEQSWLRVNYEIMNDSKELIWHLVIVTWRGRSAHRCARSEIRIRDSIVISFVFTKFESELDNGVLMHQNMRETKPNCKVTLKGVVIPFKCKNYYKRNERRKIPQTH